MKAGTRMTEHLAPGAVSIQVLSGRVSIRVATKTIDVAGGLGGLMVDLRDVPLRLPDRADRRRDLLAAWQSSLWLGSEG